METKTLWLIRHAKSAWPAGVADFDRPLAARGHRQARVLQRWLADQDAPAQRLLTSPARRAAATAACVSQAFGLAESDVEARAALYLANAQTLLNALRSLPDAVPSAAIVAHNPGITDCVNRLSGLWVTDNLPTFGVARFTAAGAWRSLAFGAARLEGWTSPGKLEERA